MALLNTHATVKKFMHFGAKEDLAEAIVEAINEQNNELATTSQLALAESNLSSEIASLRSELKSEISSVRSELKTEISEVRSELKLEIASVKSDIASLRSDSKWSMNIIMVLLGGLITLLAPLGIQTIIQMIKPL